MKHPLKLAVIFMLTGISLILFGLSGCTSPLVSANLSNEVNISDSANGNTVPVSAVP